MGIYYHSIIIFKYKYLTVIYTMRLLSFGSYKSIPKVTSRQMVPLTSKDGTRSPKDRDPLLIKTNLNINLVAL